MNESVASVPDRFPIYVEEVWIRDRLSTGIRTLLRRPTLCPRDVASLGILLHAIELLPRVDPAVDLEISVTPGAHRGLDLSLTINDEELSFALIERFAEPQGMETACAPVASFHVDGHREFGETWSLHRWLATWRGALQSDESKVDIFDSSVHEAIDWDQKPQSTDFLDDDDESD